MVESFHLLPRNCELSVSTKENPDREKLNYYKFFASWLNLYLNLWYCKKVVGFWPKSNQSIK